MQVSGSAQGTSYHITYLSAGGINYQAAFDSILKKIDSSMSTYLPASLISRINRNDSSALPDQLFLTVLKKSREVSDKTGGLFDVTIAPLVNAWGFGFSKKEKVDSAMIDSLLPLVGYKKLTLQGIELHKKHPGMQLDFNAIAQGYSVDLLAAFLEKKGIYDYLVELGGELKARGKKHHEHWKVGIEQPGEEQPDERKLEAVITLYNKALATSGNYRKFYEEGGQKYAHIIDPRTGYPAKQNLLSATVIAADGITADAYATAFMVMGLQRSQQFLHAHPELALEVYFIYDDRGKWKTFASESLKDRIQQLR